MIVGNRLDHRIRRMFTGKHRDEYLLLVLVVILLQQLLAIDGSVYTGKQSRKPFQNPLQLWRFVQGWSYEIQKLLKIVQVQPTQSVCERFVHVMKSSP